MSVLQTINLKKYYGTEPNITRALDGVNFSVEDEMCIRDRCRLAPGRTVACRYDKIAFSPQKQFP